MRKLVLIGSSVLALLISLVPGSPASATGFLDSLVPPPSDHIVIDVVTVNGTGCPANKPGSATVAVSPDNTAFTVTYSEYQAAAGLGAARTDARKNCQLNIMVHVPTGFTYAVAQADYRGFADLEAGATATEMARYYFQGQSQTAFISHNLRGEMFDDWQTTDQTDIAAIVWHPCGAQRNLNINTELRMSAPANAKQRSWIQMDSTDGSITTLYHLAWMTCPR